MAGAAATDPRGNSGDAGADRQETGREKNLADLTEGRDIHPGPTVRERIRSLVLSTGLRTLNWTGLSRLVGRRYRGRGTILMFHDFVKTREGTLDQGCEISVLDTLLARLRAEGRDIVTLDEGLTRLSGDNPRPFVVLTFDDGYRSNRDLALPVLERHEAPATIYVPTGSMDGTLNAWWLGLLALFRDREAVDFEPMNTRFQCPDTASKIWGLRRATAWVWQNFRRSEQLGPLFAANDVCVPDLVRNTFLRADEVRELDKHPLVSIGAHTRTHRALGLLKREDAVADIAGNKADLETLLQREVPHFAYPYGPPSITGTREAKWLAEIGFASAVTTTPGCLFPGHRKSPMLLPRQNAESPEDGHHLALCGVEGVIRALSARGGDPVARPGGVHA